MQLYFSPLACSMAARIVIAEAGADVEMLEVDPATKRVLATGESYLEVYPLGMVPALRTDKGLFLTENAAILQYVADEYPETGLAPPATDRIARAKLQQWLSFIGTELHKALFIPLLDKRTPAEAAAMAVEKGRSRLDYLNRHLEGRTYLLDRFTVADAYLATVLNWTMATPQINLADWPAVKAYADRLRQRPSLQRALGIEYPLFQAEQARRKAA